MSEMSEYWNDIKKHQQNKRASNRESSIEVLQQAGIHFTTNNNGVHLIVEGREGFIDYWPGTGRWKDRSGISGFGVFNLVKYIKGDFHGRHS